jgi:hypothetical protein
MFAKLAQIRALRPGTPGQGRLKAAMVRLSVPLFVASVATRLSAVGTTPSGPGRWKASGTRRLYPPGISPKLRQPTWSAG